jgi:hypothetical protein
MVITEEGRGTQKGRPFLRYHLSKKNEKDEKENCEEVCNTKRPIYRQLYNRFSNWIEIDNLCKIAWWSVLLMHLFQSSPQTVTFRIISVTYMLGDGGWGMFLRTWGFLCHCVSWTGTVYHFIFPLVRDSYCSKDGIFHLRCMMLTTLC